MYDYNEYVMKFWDEFTKVVVRPEKVRKIEEHLPILLATKKKEKLHQIDDGQEYKRHMTGYLGEAAVEQLLGIKITDWSIGNSANYNRPDIPGYRIGIKTAEKGNFHTIFKHNDYPQIMCIRDMSTSNEIMVCGLATSRILNTYQDTSLIKKPKLAVRGVKTGFYGYEYLIPVESISDISLYRRR